MEVTSDGDKSKKSAASGDQSGIKNDKPPEKEPQPTQFTEEQIFKNPYGILAQLASQAGESAPSGHSTKGLAIVEIVDPGHKGGEAYRDPFDPLAWKSVTEPKEKVSADEAAVAKVEAEKVEAGKLGTDKIGAGKVEAKLESKEAVKSPGTPEKRPVDGVAGKQAKGHEAKAIPPSPPSTAPAKKNDVESAKQAGDATPVETKEDTKSTASSAKTAIAVRQQLIQKLKQSDPNDNPTLEVKQTKEGVLISLTDSLSFDMFAVGSAEPKAQLVVLMEKVASTLRDYKGKIVIRGHTDSRRFRNRDYDNWRLSTARAQMAYYMLIRAGVNEDSVERIEGYADRNLKIPDRPESAGNRRIEILLKVDEP